MRGSCWACWERENEVSKNWVKWLKVETCSLSSLFIIIITTIGILWCNFDLDFFVNFMFTFTVSFFQKRKLLLTDLIRGKLLKFLKMWLKLFWGYSLIISIFN